MADTFRVPGFRTPVENPAAYVAGVLRSFQAASQALGVAVDILVLRFARAAAGKDPDYQIQTLDGEDVAAFSGATHDFLHDDITIRIEEDRLQDGMFTAEQAKDWMNMLNGEGLGGGAINPILSDRWLEADVSDPRD